ncbi:ABC transporter substrate-binding protein [Candidatus Nitrospira nitrificans]|uniref:Putative Vitamin B12 import system, periplasmic binding protein BtuF n=1 Tax=Candidatus Nitrospira nitrificans TaxID=1742973 RepID=A0A0S4LSN5_9BACT|nr:cobalamin-binding protein [Candidatus Nitrospira nitrificans]CUS39044.1 putative Vitamin B12 import system, periplasmic binding protein BtuF [Candidatus Nitrospira nitrificans]
MKKRVQSSGSIQALGIFLLNSWKRYYPLGTAWLLVALFLPLAPSYGCNEEECGEMKRRQQGILTGMPFMAHVSSRAFVDDAGRRIYLAKPPARIVSLAPSITEMLFALGLDEQVVGVTEFCDYPTAAKSKAKVGYSNPSVEALVALQPDLVLAPKDFLHPDLQTMLDQLKIPLFVLEASTVEDIPLQIQTLGKLFERGPAANEVTQAMRQRIADIRRRAEVFPRKRVLYVLNSHPLISVGPGSFIHQMIGLAGGINIASQANVAYPRLSMETVLKEDPEVLIFPSGDVETVPRSEQQQWRRWDSLSAVKQHRFHEVSSNLLNRPGPRIVEGLEQLARAIHPDIFGSDAGNLRP